MTEWKMPPEYQEEPSLDPATDEAEVRARYPNNRQGRRAAERALRKVDK